MHLKKTSGVIALALAAAFSQAVTFSNIVYSFPPLSMDADHEAIGNSISFTTPNAIVGDASPLRSGELNIQYNADAGALLLSIGAVVSLGAPTLGSGTVTFTETVWELDPVNNVTIGAPIGTISHLFNSSTGSFFSGTISLSRQVQHVRVLKSFELNAPTTAALDLAAVAIVNQSINTAPVPEPATLAVLGLGAALVAKRRRK